MSIAQAVIASSVGSQLSLTYYGISYDPMAEGQTNQAGVGYAGASNSVIYWRIEDITTSAEHWAGGVTPYGSATVSGSGTYYFNWTSVADHKSEGDMSYRLVVSKYSDYSSPVASYVYTLADTSRTPGRIANWDGFYYGGSGDWVDIENSHVISTNGTTTWNSGNHSLQVPSAIGTDASSAFEVLNPTVAVWVNFNSLPGGGDHPLIYAYSWALRVDTANTLNLVKYNVADQIINLSQPFQTGQWYHIVASVDTNETRYYVNGVKVGAYANSGTFFVLSNQLTLNSASNLNVNLGKVQMYNYPLSDVAALGLYNSECADYSLTALSEPSVLQSATAILDPMLYTNNGTLADQTGNGHDMTVINPNSSITYASTNRGIFSGNGGNVSDKVKMTADFSSGAYTFLSASRSNNTRNGRLLSADNNWLLGTWNAFENTYYGGNWVYPISGQWTADNGIDVRWRIHTGTMDTSGNGEYKYYTNGVMKADNTASSYGPVNPQMFSSGAPEAPNEQGAGDHGVFVVWDRVLTDQEIQDAVDYYRTRYGL